MTSNHTTDTPRAGVYQVVSSASEIILSVKHLFGLATVRGHVSIISGELVVADDPTASSVSVVADAASFESGDRRRDRVVTAAKFLDVQRYPSLHFTSTATSAEASKPVVTGVLTARGVSAPLQLFVTEVRADATGVTIRATGRVDRHDHQITAARGLAGRNVDVQITARAVLDQHSQASPASSPHTTNGDAHGSPS